jgi:hypothetical protein
MSRSRRGAAALELALGLGVLVLMMGAVVDYGLYMRDLAYANLAVREAARMGTQTDRRAGPESAALARLDAVLDEAGYLGRERTADAKLIGASPNLGINVTLSLASTPVVGLVTLPDHAAAEITMRLQDQ